jgi:hypothetical protein
MRNLYERRLRFGSCFQKDHKFSGFKRGSVYYIYQSKFTFRVSVQSVSNTLVTGVKANGKHSCCYPLKD